MRDKIFWAGGRDTEQMADAPSTRKRETSKPTEKKPGLRPGTDERLEEEVGVTVEELASLYLLDSVDGFGPQKFKSLHEKDVPPIAVIRTPSELPIVGSRADGLRKEIEKARQDLDRVFRPRAVRQIDAAHRLGASILTYTHPSYPVNVLASNNAVPVLYARGNLANLANTNAVACVGTRMIRPPYDELHERFARVACRLRFSVVSGFALGADTIGHRAALESGGVTVCIMPGGLDRPFPPENKDLWNDLLSYQGAVMLSEFAFGTGASALTLRKRNKTIVSFALGVLVSQSAEKSGAMNAYRCGVEQRKPVSTFETDNETDTSGNRVIATDLKAGGTSFSRRSDDTSTYEKWISRLRTAI